MKTLFGAGAAIALFALAGAASATPVQWVGNGHYYEFIGAEQTDWLTDNAAATAMNYAGFQGYLATITSAGENAFIMGVADGNLSWIGASDDASQGTTEGRWVWTGGPEAGQNFWNGLSGGAAVGGAYTNWNGGEPNNAGGAENFIELNWAGSSGWNDAGTSTPQTIANGYIVEYGGTGGAVPEPAGWGLMIVGIGSTGALLRNRRRMAFAAL